MTRLPTGGEARPAAEPDLPTELTLADGEQEVLLGGMAAVAVEFGRMGEMEVLTLRLHAGGKTENHAVLGAGARYTLEVGEEVLTVSVLRVDWKEGRVALRVDRQHSQ